MSWVIFGFRLAKFILMFSCHDCMSIVRRIVLCQLGEGLQVLILVSASAVSPIFCLVYIRWEVPWYNRGEIFISQDHCSTYQFAWASICEIIPWVAVFVRFFDGDVALFPRVRSGISQVFVQYRNFHRCLLLTVGVLCSISL